MSLAERIRVLSEAALFKQLSEEQVAILARATDVVSFTPGQHVVRQGDTGDSLFIIVSGQVQVLAQIERDGIRTEVAVAWLLPGDALGELALLDGQPRSASCVAHSATTCIRLARDGFLHALHRHWELNLALLALFAQRLRAADVTMAEQARDGLTGLYHRRALMERYQRELARAQYAAAHDSGSQATWSLAVLFCDVDRFKVINDTYGHHIGDEVLCSVAKVLTRAVRGTDVPARYAGDEFVVLLPEAHLDGATRVLERIRETVIHNPPGPVPFTLSIGMALVDPEHPKPLDELLKEADSAMYRDKARLSGGLNAAAAGHN